MNSGMMILIGLAVIVGVCIVQSVCVARAIGGVRDQLYRLVAYVDGCRASLTLSEQWNRRALEILEENGPKWRRLAYELAEVYSWCAKNHAELQHGNLMMPEVMFSIVLLGHRRGQSVFHGKTPKEALRRCEAHLGIGSPSTTEVCDDAKTQGGLYYGSFAKQAPQS